MYGDGILHAVNSQNQWRIHSARYRLDLNSLNNERREAAARLFTRPNFLQDQPDIQNNNNEPGQFEIPVYANFAPADPRLSDEANDELSDEDNEPGNEHSDNELDNNGGPHGLDFVDDVAFSGSDQEDEEEIDQFMDGVLSEDNDIESEGLLDNLSDGESEAGFDGYTGGNGFAGMREEFNPINHLEFEEFVSKEANKSELNAGDSDSDLDDEDIPRGEREQRRIEKEQVELERLREPMVEMTPRELRDLAFSSIIHKYYAPRSLANSMRNFMFEYSDGVPKIRTLQTSKRLLDEVTDLKIKYYDCCHRGCLSYSHPQYKKDESCANCGNPRYTTTGGRKKAVARHVYIPLKRRLQLSFSDHATSRLQKVYPKQEIKKYEDSGDDRTTTDFWTGKHFRRLREKGHFGDDVISVALQLATDGVKVQKVRVSFNCWPIILTNLNLPPRVRFLRKNLIFAGFVPGPDNPGMCLYQSRSNNCFG